MFQATKIFLIATKVVNVTVANVGVASLGLVNIGEAVAGLAYKGLDSLIKLTEKITVVIIFLVTIIGPLIIKIFVLIFSILLLSYFILCTLYYLISKIDSILNNNKEFQFVEINKFISYIIKYMVFILIISFIYSIFLPLLVDLLEGKLNSFYVIIKNCSMSISWISFIILFYMLIILWSNNLFSNLNNYILLYFYRWCVFVILRSIMLTLCPVEYSEFFTLGIVSLIFPDILSDISDFLTKLLGFLDNNLSEGPVAYAQSPEEEYHSFDMCLVKLYPDNKHRQSLDSYTKLHASHHKANAPHLTMDIAYLTSLAFYNEPQVEDKLYCIVESMLPKKGFYMEEVNKISFTSSKVDFNSMISTFYKIEPDHDGFFDCLSVNYVDGNTDYFLYNNEKEIPNFHMSDRIICYPKRNKPCEVYDPSNPNHDKRNLKLKDAMWRKEVVSLGTSRSNVCQSPEIHPIKAAFLKEKYNTACIHKHPN